MKGEKIMSYADEGDRHPWDPRSNITVGIILAMVVFGGSAAWYYHDAIFGSGTSSRNARLERELNMGAQMINRRVPIRVDEITTLIGAETQGTQFTYKYTISEDIPTARIEEARQALQRDVGARLCADPNMSQALRNGATISADYRDTSGDHIRVTFPACSSALR
jgi:hypothetical protein